MDVKKEAPAEATAEETVEEICQDDKTECEEFIEK